MLTRLIAAVTTVILAITLPGNPAQATASDDPPATGRSVVPVRVDPSNATSGSAVFVECYLRANDPILYPGEHLILGDGFFSSCWPADPDVCRVETDLEVYNPYSSLWQVYASGPVKYGPPCKGLKSRAASYGCEPSSRQYSYRTRAYGTIVEGGIGTSAVATSPSVRYYCY